MTSRKTLFATASGPFQPTTLTPTRILAVQKGGGVLSQDPHAFFANGRTHLGYASQNGVNVATYDHATKAVLTGSPNELANFGTPETHYTVAPLVRLSDSKVFAAYAPHTTSSFIGRGVSPTANDIAGVWSPLGDIASSTGSTSTQFASVVQLGGLASDPIFIFYEDRVGGGSGTSRLVYTKSTDDGATWSAQTVVFSKASSTFPAWRISSDWDTRIDVQLIPSDAYSGNVSLYHCYFDGTTWRKSDGTALTTPFDESTMTMIYDGSADGAFPAGIVTNSGLPFCVFYTKVDSTHNAVKRARWTGSAWAVDTVLASQNAFSGDRFSTGLTLLEDGVTVYLGDVVSGTVELFRYVTPDGGSTWQPTQLTVASGAGEDNIQVCAVIHGRADFPVIWYRGTLTSSTSYDLDTYGLVPA